MTNPSDGRNTSSTNNRFFSGIAVKDYVNAIDDDFVDDGFVPEDDDGIECERTDAGQDAAASPTIECEVIESLGQQRLHVQAKEAGRLVWEKLIHADVEDEIRQAAREVAEWSRQSIEGVEHLLATKVAEARQARAKSKADKGETHFLAGVMDTASFDTADCRRDWLVKKLLVRNEPVLIGGPKKSLKTSLVVDLAISLGTGSRFLGKFEVPARQRCLVLSGESGAATLQETARRVCAARGVAMKNCDVRWGFRLPQLSSASDLQRLTDYIRKEAIQVVIIDPLYLCLIQAGLNVQTSNLFQVGPLLLEIAQACQEAKATPILVHHARKQAGIARAVSHEPLDLDDLAYSGFAEFARQWVLISRREAFEPGTGLHKLWLNVGGSAGQGGLWGVDVEEGILRDDFGGRTWKTRVLDRDAIQKEKVVAARIKKSEHEEHKREDAMQAVLKVLMDNGEGETPTGIRDQVTQHKALVPAILNQLERQGRIRPAKVKKKHGKSGEAFYDGWAMQSWGLIEPAKVDSTVGKAIGGAGETAPAESQPAAGALPDGTSNPDTAQGGGEES
jgi:hypothetical protein